MHDIWPILLFIAISSYHVYLRDITQAFTILYLIVSNQAEPYYTISAHLQPDYITEMGIPFSTSTGYWDIMIVA